MIGEVYIMKKSKILFILLVAIFSTVFSLRVNAATSFPNQITTSIVAWDPVVVKIGILMQQKIRRLLLQLVK